MPTVNIPVSAPTRAGSHWIEPRSWKKAEESVYLTFESKWRGQDVTVQFQANKYLHSSGWSEWRIFTQQARPTGGGYGTDLSDTARARLREAHIPAINEWLASDAYKQSRANAFQQLVKRIIGDCRDHDEIPRVYEFVLEHRHEFSDEFVAKVDQTLIAYDEFSRKFKDLA